MKRLIILIICLFPTFSIGNYATSTTAGEIEGEIIDSNNNPVVTASVLLYNMSGMLVKSTNTGSDGEFFMNMIPQGLYILKAFYKKPDASFPEMEGQVIVNVLNGITSHIILQLD